jgi:hypothetical protein
MRLAGVGGLMIVGVAKARGTDTRGRWPWVAAVSAPPATVAAYANRERFSTVGGPELLASLPLLLWHQTEEWVLPAGFLSWINRSLWRSADDEFPLTPRMAFRVNVVAGWGLSALAALSFKRAPSLAGGLLASHVANGALHIGRAIAERGYNPGLATALLLGPVGAIGASGMVRDRHDHTRGALAGVLTGLMISAALPLWLRRRARGTTRQGSAKVLPDS